MALSRGIDGPDPVRADPVAQRGGGQEEERRARSTHLATGTLACPRCDAPVALAGQTVGPGDALECPYCGEAGAVRDFLSLAAPSRPARVEVRVVRGARAA